MRKLVDCLALLFFVLIFAISLCKMVYFSLIIILFCVITRLWPVVMLLSSIAIFIVLFTLKIV